MQYNQQRVLDRLIEMIKINSVSYKEGPMTDYLQKYFEDLGYEVYRDNAGEKIGGDHGGNLIIHIGGDREGHIGVFSHGGHYVAAIGQQADGRIIVLDPSYKPGKYEEEGRKGKVEMKNDFVCLCDPQLLVADTATRDPGFYLFWRA